MMHRNAKHLLAAAVLCALTTSAAVLLGSGGVRAADPAGGAADPLVADGVDGVMAFLNQAGRVPCEVKRIAIEGDLAFVHVRYLSLFGQETAGVDIFRFDANGKILEHWDVLQPVPSTSKNANTMF